MVKLWVTFLLVLVCASLYAQQFSMGLGVYTGITSSFTIDNGINQDARYAGSYGIKFAPIGINFGMDYEGFGFLASPGIINLGQDFYVVNTSGGQDGKRTSELQYLNVPVAFKVHIINLSFFKISGLASIGAGFLTAGSEVVGHTPTKLRFLQEVYPILPADYTVQYDGVVAPEVNGYIISEKKDFNTFQLFVAVGFRSDWDISNHWRISVDFRMNYGIYEPRTDEYIDRLNAYQILYAIPGKRRDMFAQLSVGISRYFDFEKSDRQQTKRLKGSSKKSTRYPYAKPRNKKPAG